MKVKKENEWLNNKAINLSEIARRWAKKTETSYNSLRPKVLLTNNQVHLSESEQTALNEVLTELKNEL